MQKHVLIIGAGIIGATTALQLSRSGARVTVVSGDMPRATDASFGWINASFFADEAHYRLRHAGISASRRLMHDFALSIQNHASLCWETNGAAFDAQYATLDKLGCKVRVIDAAGFRQMEPNVENAPDRALLFEDEAAVASHVIAAEVLARARHLGARTISGVRVLGVAEARGQVTGVRSAIGDINADQVVVAAGVGTEHLVASVGQTLPMLRRPGLMLRTRPVKPLINHILASESQEVRQLPDGTLLAPVAAGHQADATETLHQAPDVLADQALDRLQAMFPSVDLAWDHVMLADRPMPKDGLPVVGQVGPKGLYVATMHSGITLGALMGELIATEIMQGVSNETAALLAPYRPQRFEG